MKKDILQSDACRVCWMLLMLPLESTGLESLRDALCCMATSNPDIIALPT